MKESILKFQFFLINNVSIFTLYFSLKKNLHVLLKIYFKFEPTPRVKCMPRVRDSLVEWRHILIHAVPHCSSFSSSPSFYKRKTQKIPNKCFFFLPISIQILNSHGLSRTNPAHPIRLGFVLRPGAGIRRRWFFAGWHRSCYRRRRESLPERPRFVPDREPAHGPRRKRRRLLRNDVVWVVWVRVLQASWGDSGGARGGPGKWAFQDRVWWRLRKRQNRWCNPRWTHFQEVKEVKRNSYDFADSVNFSVFGKSHIWQWIPNRQFVIKWKGVFGWVYAEEESGI